MGPRFLLKDLFVCVLFWIESLIWRREGILCILFPRLLCWTPAPVFLVIIVEFFAFRES